MSARALPAIAVLLFSASAAAGPDELSGADKLRVLYATQFSFTREGLPLVTIGLAEGLKEVRVRGPARLLPDGEMGPEVSAGQEWTIRLVGQQSRAERRYHVIVGRGLRRLQHPRREPRRVRAAAPAARPA